MVEITEKEFERLSTAIKQIVLNSTNNPPFPAEFMTANQQAKVNEKAITALAIIYRIIKREAAKTASPHVCFLCNEPIVESSDDEDSTEQTVVEEGEVKYYHYGCGEEEQETQSDPATKDYEEL